jgi:hypothetical protein
MEGHCILITTLRSHCSIDLAPLSRRSFRAGIASKAALKAPRERLPPPAHLQAQRPQSHP